ncbi:hypothetical protein CHAN_10390 [Corynebacterium hansenii]|nr:hypothetical protein CHAN_10390 [Corynebacterium hansenii]
MIAGVIVGSETRTITERGRAGAYRRVYATVLNVEIDTRDLARVDLSRPVTIHQEADNA